MDEPVTPTGRFFLQPEIQQVINCAVSFRDPVDVPAVKDELRRTFLRFHHRMSCLLTRDKHGREHWRPAPDVDIDKHVILVADAEEDDDDAVWNTAAGGATEGGGSGKPEEEEEEEPEADEGDNARYINDYMASLTVSAPLPTDKPLWEVHVLPARRRCCVLRLHHALGDGAALMSLFLACCERADDPSVPVTVPTAGGGGRRSEGWRAAGARGPRLLWRALLVAWYTLLYVADFLLHGLWVKDDKTPITGGKGVELWPRKLVTASFALDDLKIVKRAVNATINDVLVGIISYGFARYFESKCGKEPPKDVRITGLSMVNIRQNAGLQEITEMIRKGSHSQWRNELGMILLPIYLGKSFYHPLEYVTRAKAIIDRKKLSLEALFSYKGGALIMSLFGTKVATLLNYRIISNTTFTLSNIVGPLEVIMFARNPITRIQATSNSLPHATTIHMVSYHGRADMQILVAKDIVHDPEVLAKCFQEALKEMKLCAVART